MTKIKDIFNTVAQGAKDTVNGLSFKSFWGVAQIGAIGLCTLQVASAVAAGTLTFGILPAVLGAAMLANANYNGRQRRQAGMSLHIG
jgi:hypothetical protein